MTNPYSNLDLAAAWDRGYVRELKNPGSACDDETESARRKAYEEGRVAARQELRWEPLTPAAKEAVRSLFVTASEGNDSC